MIADFGVSRTANEDDVLMTVCGSPGYCAPEILLNQGHNTKADLWSVGVVTFTMLCGYSPFGPIDDPKGLMDRMMTGNIDFNERYWKYISAEAKDFVRKLLTLDPHARPSATEALAHPWLQPKPDDADAHVAAANILSEHVRSNMLTIRAQRVGTDVGQWLRAWQQATAADDDLVHNTVGVTPLRDRGVGAGALAHAATSVLATRGPLAHAATAVPAGRTLGRRDSWRFPRGGVGNLFRRRGPGAPASTTSASDASKTARGSSTDAPRMTLNPPPPPADFSAINTMSLHSVAHLVAAVVAASNPTPTGSLLRNAPHLSPGTNHGSLHSRTVSSAAAAAAAAAAASGGANGDAAELELTLNRLLRKAHAAEKPAAPTSRRDLDRVIFGDEYVDRSAVAVVAAAAASSSTLAADLPGVVPFPASPVADVANSSLATATAPAPPGSALPLAAASTVSLHPARDDLAAFHATTGGSPAGSPAPGPLSPMSLLQAVLESETSPGRESASAPAPARVDSHQASPEQVEAPSGGAGREKAPGLSAWPRDVSEISID
ncbi:CAMK/CAMK1 protein kinase, variant [Allomyces macrogynus ATCC 38327]|nr:CAMK/CAMK1 protein kinase, variant [Allomyces macrogynus ATCC 38327]|eukprot:KNE71300.1 CAMK/CAMK1 protein kinase, variant [Allomyces macrogynus ATCC 38327]